MRNRRGTSLFRLTPLKWQKDGWQKSALPAAARPQRRGLASSSGRYRDRDRLRDRNPHSGRLAEGRAGRKIISGTVDGRRSLICV